MSISILQQAQLHRVVRAPRVKAIKNTVVWTFMFLRLGYRNTLFFCISSDSFLGAFEFQTQAVQIAAARLSPVAHDGVSTWAHKLGQLRWLPVR